MIGKLPTELEMTRALVSALEELKSYGPEITDMDVRLQVIPSEAMDWYLHTGDAQYDTDHRGAWGAANIFHKATIEDLRETARDLLAQVDEMLADE